MNAVVVNNLSRYFGSFKAVDTISFEVKTGEIFGFLGANGAGKTTTIRILCGLLMPTSGTAVVSGYDVATDSEKVKLNIGYMSQKFSLYPDLTIKENIYFYGNVYGLAKQKLREKCAELLVSLELTEEADTLVSNLPLGWKQKLALSTALLHEPKIIFLDEPTSGVDPVARDHFWSMIRQLAARGTTVFVTTHYMDEAEYCDRLSIMQEGRILALDTPANLKQKYNELTMQDVFMHVQGGADPHPSLARHLPPSQTEEGKKDSVLSPPAGKGDSPLGESDRGDS